jgi:zinc transport system ATP-binding protein
MDKIVIKNLSFAYNSSYILRDVNISIKANEIITIVGPNGGGKTTLLRLILGLLKPAGGTILINGNTPQKERRKIGYVPQHTYFDRKFPITVFEVVLMSRIKAFGFYTKNDKESALKALFEIGLTGLNNEPFFNLSGGQMQRVLIARALSAETEILLLDEPTANIDPVSGKHLNSLLIKLNKKLTILLVTHDVGFVTNITQRVFCVNRTVVEHPLEELKDDTISSAYSSGIKLVRHDHHIGELSHD